MLLFLLACAGPGTDETTGTDTETDTDTGIEDTGPSAEGFVQVYGGGGAAGVDVAIAPDGAIYTSWVADRSLWIAVSDDGGATFAAPVEVAAGTSPLSNQGQHPTLAVDATRIAVGIAGNGHQYVYVASRDTLAFERTEITADGLKFETIFIRPELSPEGELWATFHAFPSGSGWSGGWKGVARESRGFAVESMTDGAPGEPCECCPHDLLFTSEGDAVFAYRNNIENIRDIWVAGAPDAGEFASWTIASDTAWEIHACPVQGPRLAEGADGRLILAWGDASDGVYDVRVATSDDGGATWSASAPLDAEGTAAYRSARLIADGDGHAWAAFERDGGSWLVASTDDGGGWGAPLAVESPGGALQFAELAAGGGRVVLAGATASGDVWLKPIE